jgi:magnesium-transporting ATPase (P-type)
MISLTKKLTKSAPAAAVAMQLFAGSALAVAEISPPQGFALDIGSLITQVLTFVFIIAILLVFLYIIWGGVEWITSGGDKGKTESARNRITAAVIGLVILLASFAILQLVLQFFTGGQGLNEILQREL